MYKFTLNCLGRIDLGLHFLLVVVVLLSCPCSPPGPWSSVHMVATRLGTCTFSNPRLARIPSLKRLASYLWNEWSIYLCNSWQRSNKKLMNLWFRNIADWRCQCHAKPTMGVDDYHGPSDKRAPQHCCRQLVRAYPKLLRRSNVMRLMLTSCYYMRLKPSPGSAWKREVGVLTTVSPTYELSGTLSRQ